MQVQVVLYGNLLIKTIRKCNDYPDTELRFVRVRVDDELPLEAHSNLLG